MECPICLNALEIPYTTLCGHQFHLLCLISWLKKHQSCPYCRKEIQYECLQPIKVIVFCS